MELGLVGLIAGVLGGLAGIGGSMIMLPALHWVLGDPRPSVHHLYIAAALTVNIAVALPAAWRHNRSGAVRHDLLKRLIISAIVGITVGVLVSNLAPGDVLRVCLGVFLLCYCVFNIYRVITPMGTSDTTGTPVPSARLLASGAITGLVGGVLGLGGGVVLVPLLQLGCRVRLKEAIATSSAVICISAIVGASLKLFTLHAVGEQVADALSIACVLAPTAIIGGVLGATLTHKLPNHAVRVVVTILLLIAAAKLFKLF